MTNQVRMGRPPFLENGQKITLYLDAGVKRKLLAIANERRVTRSAVVRDLIQAAAQKPESTEAA